MPWGTFKLAELSLDQKNIRTGDQPDQRAALGALIADQKQKLTNLAIDIMKMGRLSPGEPLWVTPDPDASGKQIVLEGNRRVAALKLMENPRLADGTDVAAAFAQLAKEFAERPIRSVEATIFESREEAWPWLQRRHMGGESGVALQRWRSLAKERAQPGWSGRVRRSLMVLDFLDDDTDEFGDVGAVIEAKSTTVDRVLNNPDMREVLGVDIDTKAGTINFENGNEIAGRRLLRDMIGELAGSGFSRVRDKEDRKAFIREFSDRSVKQPGGAPAAPPPSGGATVVAFPKAVSRPRLSEPPRPYLAPGGARSIPKVKGDRLKKLYKECRQIKLEGNENAAALLLRVFIELSSETFLTEKSVPLPSKFTSRPTPLTDWGEVGITLHDKVSAVLELIDTSHRTSQQLKETRVALNKGSHAPGSIGTLHAYFHNVNMMPRAVALREAWDTWEAYLTLLHANRT